MDEAHPQKPSPEGQSLAEIPPCRYVIVGAEEPPPPRFSANLLLFGAAGAGALFLLGASMTPTVGATHSTRLKWQQRQLEIEEAAQDAELTDCPRE
jgi:hypothetical protein